MEFVRDGRQEAFEEIVRRYAGMVFSTCLGVLRDTHDAEDATQAVFLQLAVQAKIFGRTPDTRMWTALPLFWTAGMNTAMGATLAAGGCWVMLWNPVIDEFLNWRNAVAAESFRWKVARSKV